MSREQEVANQIVEHYLKDPEVERFLRDAMKELLLYGFTTKSPEDLEIILKRMLNETT